MEKKKTCRERNCSPEAGLCKLRFGFISLLLSVALLYKSIRTEFVYGDRQIYARGNQFGLSVAIFIALVLIFERQCGLVAHFGRTEILDGAGVDVICVVGPVVAH